MPVSTPLGDRTAVACTSGSRLTATLGPGPAWIRLAEPALRAAVREGRARLLVRRESLEDIRGRDVASEACCRSSAAPAPPGILSSRQ